MYEQLALKYKPLNFTEGFFGNEINSKEFRKRSIKFNYPQSMLFKGKSGTGKTSSFKIIAKTLSCDNPVELENGEHIPCEKCASCNSINNETYINTNVIVFKSNVTGGKEDVSYLEEIVYTSSFNIKPKIIIIEEAHNLSNAAKERLLTLTESNLKNIYFIMITSEEFKFKITSTSRCIPYTFNYLTTEDLMDFGSYILKKENLFETIPDSFLFDNSDTKSKSVIRVLAENSCGSARLFLTYLERCIMAEQYTSEEIYKLLDFDNISEEKIYDILLGILSKSKESLVDLKNLKDVESFYYKSKAVLSDAFIYKITNEIDDWKKSLANKLIKFDIINILNKFESVKIYPYVDKSSLLLKIFEYYNELVRRVLKS